MDFIFLKLWTQEVSKNLINTGFKNLFWDGEKYIFEFSNNYLNISLFSGDPLCFLSNNEIEQKEETAFTKLISQHFNKSICEKISIAKNDKVIFIYFKKDDIYGKKVEYKLILELINRYENLIFTRQDANDKWIILDSHKRISFSESRYRQILPGQEYQSPPPIKKPYILDLNKERFYNLFEHKLPQEWKDFIKNFSNVPKFLKDEFIPEMPVEDFWQVICKVKNKGRFGPRVRGDDPNLPGWGLQYIIFYNSEEKLLSMIRTKDSQGFSSVNNVFQFYYNEKCQKAQLTQLKNRILHKLKKQTEQIQKTLKKESEELSQMEDADKWKKFGELIKINFSKIKKGLKEIVVTDYYAENTPQITIPLNEEWNPEKNMEHYFKRYQKAKSGKAKLLLHINTNEKKLNDTLDKIEFINECEDIEKLKKFYEKRKLTRQKETKKYKFRKFSIDVNGKIWEIFVGRSNKQNDELTTKFARPDDWFFHSRIYHGAHLIVRNPERLRDIPPKVKNFAAGIAAYFSKAKHSTNVPVDFTKIRYVTKPRKSPPGFVVYRNQKTLFVGPIDPRK
ncbi:MAG: NFACT family protein [Candidatus Cloacimonetes bacterium]|nr:NFACT family protein [Candidatus Cloacimonadota bacterium]